MNKLSKRKRDEGASMIEFALIMPLLLLLVLGIIEFGFLLAQMNEIRHGAREGARYAAVSPDNATFSDIVSVTCDAINLPGTSEITVELSGSSTRGEYATIRIEADTNSLSNAPLISSVLPNSLSNEARFRMEQTAAWGGTNGPQECNP